MHGECMYKIRKTKGEEARFRCPSLSVRSSVRSRVSRNFSNRKSWQAFTSREHIHTRARPHIQHDFCLETGPLTQFPDSMIPDTRSLSLSLTRARTHTRTQHDFRLETGPLTQFPNSMMAMLRKLGTPVSYYVW